MKLFLRLFLAAVVLVTLSNLTGCATPATSQAMTVKPGTTALLNAKLKGAVSVGAVSGGKDTNPMWTSQVDNAGFKKALTDSLAITGYLAGAAAPAAYEVTATLEALEQPLFGFTFDVKSKVTYAVKGGGVERSIPVSATGTATTSDAFVAIERLRIANERSILENIREFINQLGKLAD